MKNRNGVHDKALDKLCARYENRTRNYSGAKESTEQELREIDSRSIAPSSYRLSLADERMRSANMTDGDFVDYCTASRDHEPVRKAETDTRLVLQRIDRERYKKVSPKQTEVKKADVGAALRKRSGRVSPKTDIPKEETERVKKTQTPPPIKKAEKVKKEKKKLGISPTLAIPAAIVAISVALIIISIILLVRA